MAYNPNNIFAQILRGESPCKKVYEDEHTLAIRDIKPDVPVHVQVIPKKPYTNFDDFISRANDAEIAGYFRAVLASAKAAGVESNFRIASNVDSWQTVNHLHVHVMGGGKFKPVVFGPKQEEGKLEYSKAVAYRCQSNAPGFNQIVVEPKGDYTSFADFVTRANDAEIAGYWRAVHTAAHANANGMGYRLSSSTGKEAGQTLPKFATQVVITRERDRAHPPIVELSSGRAPS